MMQTDIQVPDSESATSTTPVARVLVVDDERSMRELLSIVLRRDGYDVLLAADGKVAVETLKRERVDVLITDIRMPEMSGVDVLREAKRIDPGIISIIMTAFADDTAVVRCGWGSDYVTSTNAVRSALRVSKELGEAGSRRTCAEASDRTPKSSPTRGSSSSMVAARMLETSRRPAAPGINGATARQDWRAAVHAR